MSESDVGIIIILYYCALNVVATDLHWQKRVLYKCVAKLHLQQESDNERYHVAIEK